jgi:hypothetical protein
MQRAFTLLAPCQSALSALTATGDLTAALVSLGGSSTALPPAVKQCCTAVRPFSDALCVPLLHAAWLRAALAADAC